MSKANVVVLKAGSPKKFVDAETLGELRGLVEASNMLATINGDACKDDSKVLVENDFITFTEQVKGAAKAKPTKKTTKKSIKTRK
jgi:hypothetical protein